MIKSSERDLVQVTLQKDKGEELDINRNVQKKQHKMELKFLREDKRDISSRNTKSDL